MALRQHLGVALGQELHGLEADQGKRLEQIIWRLSVQARSVPTDIDTIVAYGHALTLGGCIAEARPVALQMLKLVEDAGDAASTRLLVNAAGASADTGLPAHAMKCIEQVLARGTLESFNPEILDSLLTHAAAVAVRYGALDWYVQRFPPMQLVAFIHAHGLAPWWPAQQQAIEAILGEHVASTVFALEDFKDGTHRLSLDYFTDLHSLREISELHDAVLDAVSTVYAEHPEGPGAFLGKVLIDVHGPEVPLEELEP